MWAYESVFYQIYPMGFANAPFENDGVQRHGIIKVIDWIPHIKSVGCNAIYFSPVFESDTHGNNTRDYKKIDVRLGTNEEFKYVCDALHESGSKVVPDGVVNLVCRGHFAFQDVLKNRENSRYLNWFNINLGGNDAWNDGLWYEGWEGNYDLVKLNLRNNEVVEYLLDCVRYWIEYFDIDGIRLDVAYCLDEDFMRRLRSFTDSMKADFFLLGEAVHGDYNRLVNDGMLHSATNYECYKGIYSALNSMNLFEIIHSLLRQFGPEQWSLYKGKHMLSFVDNHDVSRIASVITNPKHIPLAYGIEFGMPGIQCVCFGSEWGFKADKSQGDPALRPYFEIYEENELTAFTSRLAAVKKSSNALNYGDFTSVILTNRQSVYRRAAGDDVIFVAINADENPYTACFDAGAAKVTDLLTGNSYDMGSGVSMDGCSVMYLQPER